MRKSPQRIAEAYAEMLTARPFELGARAVGAVTRTSALSGVLRDIPASRAEFFASLDS